MYISHICPFVEDILQEWSLNERNIYTVITKNKKINKNTMLKRDRKDDYMLELDWADWSGSICRSIIYTRLSLRVTGRKVNLKQNSEFFFFDNIRWRPGCSDCCGKSQNLLTHCFFSSVAAWSLGICGLPHNKPLIYHKCIQLLVKVWYFPELSWFTKQLSDISHAALSNLLGIKDDHREMKIDWMPF